VLDFTVLFVLRRGSRWLVRDVSSIKLFFHVRPFISRDSLEVSLVGIFCRFFQPRDKKDEKLGKVGA